jgi:hypothetical protein
MGKQGRETGKQGTLPILVIRKLESVPSFPNRWMKMI